MKKPIHILVRTCVASSSDTAKRYPYWYSRATCLRNLFATMDPKLCEIEFLLDGKREDHFLKDYPEMKVTEGVFGSDPKSYARAIEIIDAMSLPDETIVYLLEDDYVHRPGWANVMLEGFNELGADFMTLYDHKDKYTYSQYRYLQSALFSTTSTHWRTIPSTTNTFAFRYGTFKKYRHILTNVWLDPKKFWDLWEAGSNLISPVPGYSTHSLVKYLSPHVDWEHVLKQTVGEQLPV